MLGAGLPNDSRTHKACLAHFLVVLVHCCTISLALILSLQVLERVQVAIGVENKVDPDRMLSGGFRNPERGVQPLAREERPQILGLPRPLTVTLEVRTEYLEATLGLVKCLEISKELVSYPAYFSLRVRKTVWARD